jgi:pyruvate dehydrogenase E1 component beta subunit
MSVPGLKVVAPATPADAKGLLAAAIREDDPVVVYEHKGLYGMRDEVPDGEHVVPLGRALERRAGGDLTIVGLAATVHVALKAAEALAAERSAQAQVIDLRTLVPLDARAVLEAVAKTSRLLIVEENPRPCGWGAEVASIVAEEGFDLLDAPIRRVTGEVVPLPAAAVLEDLARPTVERTLAAARALLDR